MSGNYHGSVLALDTPAVVASTLRYANGSRTEHALFAYGGSIDRSLWDTSYDRQAAARLSPAMRESKDGRLLTELFADANVATVYFSPYGFGFTVFDEARYSGSLQTATCAFARYLGWGLSDVYVRCQHVDTVNLAALKGVAIGAVDDRRYRNFIVAID